MRVLPALLMVLFCASTTGAEFNGSTINGKNCSGEACVAKVVSGGKTIGLMWQAYVVPKAEFLIAAEIDDSGSYYSLESSDDGYGQLTVGVLAERPGQNGRVVRRPQGVVIASKGSDGTYSFVPRELVGMGKVILRAIPDKPGMFSVEVRLNP